MKSVKGKNLQDFTPLLRAHSGTTCTVSDGDYCELSHLIAQRASTPGTEGGFIVGLNPSQTHHHKIVRRARTVLGSLPESLLSLLGLEPLVAGLLGSSVAPWCKRCGAPARTKPQRVLPKLPDHGFVALAVAARGVADVTLAEWCELLGAERARCKEGLVSVSDLLPDATGEPVLKVCSVAETGSVRSEAERWFASGGGERALVQATSGLRSCTLAALQSRRSVSYRVDRGLSLYIAALLRRSLNTRHLRDGIVSRIRLLCKSLTITKGAAISNHASQGLSLVIER